MKSSAIRRTAQPERNVANDRSSPQEVVGKFQPRGTDQTYAATSHRNSWLRMFTEEEVSDLLRVSLSQLRKWRMKKNQGNSQGPPFKKIGRLVRYPGPALHAYIIGGEAQSLE
jgi:hypothetical protein